MRALTATILLLALGCASPAPRAAPPAGAAHLPPPPPSETGPPSTADSTPAVDVLTHTAGRPACMLVTDAAGTVLLRSKAARCALRLRPYSTFKIPNTLIALETGVVADASTVIPWNQSAYPQQDWWPEAWTSQVHDLRSAFRYSFVPYYREAANRIGAGRMAHYVRQFRYGNQSMEGKLDSFWLDGAIAISADEQVRFLRDLYEQRLGVSPRTTKIAKEVMVRERRGDHTLSAKTGTGDAPDGGALGWLVGFVERGSNVHFFAFHVVGDSYDAIGQTWRFQTVTTMLTKLGLWPPTAVPLPTGTTDGGTDS